MSGRWNLAGELTADDGAVLAALIDHCEHARQNTEHARQNTERALPEDQRSLFAPQGERHAHALLTLCRDGAAATRPGRVSLFLHIDLDDLHRDGPRDGSPATAHTETGHDITLDTLWAMLADADVTPVFVSGGQPLSYGRTRRLAPDMLRRVIAHRDRHCRFGPCTSAPIWTHTHHRVWWNNNGTTDPPNTECECGFHHHLIHDHGWTLNDTTDSEPVIHRPDGTIHTTTPRWHNTNQRHGRNRHHEHLHQLTLQRLHTDIAQLRKD